MIDPGNNDRRTPISPRLAVRVAVLGGIALLAFTVVFFRLWYLQVLSGDSYRAEANQNRTREVTIPAPRGLIKDAGGKVLVKNHPAMVVELTPRSLPSFETTMANRYGKASGDLAAQRAALQSRAAQDKRDAANAKRKARRRRLNSDRKVALRQLKRLPGSVPQPKLPRTPEGRALARRFHRLGRVLGMSARTIQARVLRQLYMEPYANVRLKTDVPFDAYGYLLEHAQQFPGITTHPVVLRSYPHATLAAQLFGTVGEITPQELRDKSRFRGVRPGTVVGQSGIEYAYDQYLRGKPGAERISVNAYGQATKTLKSIQPTPGEDVRLSIDLGLQKAGQDALTHEMGLAGAPAGAFVAIDPRNGAVLAMGSLPSFDPNILTHPLTEAQYQAKLGDAAGDPQVNRAIASSYPTGSTFKPITALAALAAGVITPSTVITDTGSFREGGGLVRHNAGNAVYGALVLWQAIKVSSDVFFYTLGHDLYSQPGLPLQKWAHKLGFGRPTGIDIPGENGGVVPGPAWRRKRAKEELACEKKNHVPSCGLSDGDPNWREGDEVNLAVGQGDLQATPLQMAVAYSALENNGKIVVPHVAEDIEDDNGRIIQQIQPGVGRRINIDPSARQAILEGLHAATSQPGGTSADVFSGWPQSRYPVYGKTGTAQTGLTSKDQAWYVSFVPDPKRPIVIAVTVEHSGFGATYAAPVAHEMLGEWFHVATSNVQGTSQTN